MTRQNYMERVIISGLFSSFTESWKWKGLNQKFLKRISRWFEHTKWLWKWRQKQYCSIKHGTIYYSINKSGLTMVILVGGRVGLAVAAQVHIWTLSDVTTRTDQHAGVLWRVWTENKTREKRQHWSWSYMTLDSCKVLKKNVDILWKIELPATGHAVWLPSS